MTQSPPRPSPLDPLSRAAMLRTVYDALPHHPKAPVEEKTAIGEAATLLVDALRPRDPLEAALAARFVALHYHVMADLRAAAEESLPSNLQLRYQARALAMSRAMESTLKALRDRQTVAPMRPASVAVAAPDVQAVAEAVKAAAPAAVPAPDAAPAPEAVPARTPPQPVMEGRHARRRREREERRAARAKLSGLAAGGPAHAMQERRLAEVAARAAASMTA